MTARTVTVPQGFTLGDGRTAGAAARGRWSRYGWVIGIVASTLLVLTILALTKVPTSKTPLSINNAGQDGTKALAEILRHQGVSVKELDTLSDARGALGRDGTLVVAGYTYLSHPQMDSIYAWNGPVVWLAPQWGDVELSDDRLAGVDSQVVRTVEADCGLPAAKAAGSIVVEGQKVVVESEGPDITSCFGNSRSGSALVQIDRGDLPPLTVISATGFMTNGRLAQEGDAALALQLMGSRDHVAWYMGSGFDTTTLTGDPTDESGITFGAPAWTNAGLLALCITFFGAALWRGRRMGKLVTEPLPVIVPASEATRGRARLYRRGRAFGHAAAALRAGTARRTSARLGLGPHATPGELVAAIAAATGRDSTEPRELIYGPPPRDEAAMLNLVRRLDALESEVDPT